MHFTWRVVFKTCLIVLWNKKNFTNGNQWFSLWTSLLRTMFFQLNDHSCVRGGLMWLPAYVSLYLTTLSHYSQLTFYWPIICEDRDLLQFIFPTDFLTTDSYWRKSASYIHEQECYCILIGCSISDRLSS